MPLRPSWLQRLPEIIREVRCLTVDTIDRPSFEQIFQLRRRRSIELMHLLGSKRSRRGFVLDRGALLQKLESFGFVAQYRWEQHTKSPWVMERAVAGRPDARNGNHQGPRRLVIEFLGEDELTEKLLSALRTVCLNKIQQNGVSELQISCPQYDRFRQAVGAFRNGNLQRARELFAQACAGPQERIRSAAEEYLRICNRRLEPATEPQSSEEHYNCGVALLNARHLAEARKHFESALRLDPNADYVHYALAACFALSGDTEQAYLSLRRAIELQPRNRLAARHDRDFECVLRDARFTQLFRA